MDCVNKATYLEITNASPMGIELTVGWMERECRFSLPPSFSLSCGLCNAFFACCPHLARRQRSDRYSVADFKVAPPPGMSRQKWDLKRE